MALSDRITAMYGRRVSGDHLPNFERMAGEDSEDSYPTSTTRKIRFLPDLILPDRGPIYEPVVGGSGRPRISILKCHSSGISSLRIFANSAISIPVEAPATLESSPAISLNSNERFICALQGSAILVNRRYRALASLQARWRGNQQRQRYAEMKELSKVREQRAISAAPAMIIKKTEWSDSESDEAQALIIRLEQELAGIERQRVDELEQIDGWKEQEMKRVHREASDALQESCLLEGLVKSNKERVQELRAERKRLTSDHDALRCGLRTMQEEHRHLTLESVKLRSHLKDTQEYTEAETKRGADWAMVQRKYEEHMQDLQRMIEERESRTAMEERRKKVYGRVVLEIVQVVQNHEVVKEQELIGFVRSADLASCSPLYAA